MYGNFNMGAGFAVFVSAQDAENVIKLAKKHGFRAINAGYVEEGDKQLIIQPKNITFEGKSLGVR
jgi:phosphoribosylformylglycinamidine cyclo-ligase